MTNTNLMKVFILSVAITAGSTGTAFASTTKEQTVISYEEQGVDNSLLEQQQEVDAAAPDQNATTMIATDVVSPDTGVADADLADDTAVVDNEAAGKAAETAVIDNEAAGKAAYSGIADSNSEMNTAENETSAGEVIEDAVLYSTTEATQDAVLYTTAEATNSKSTKSPVMAIAIAGTVGVVVLLGGGLAAIKKLGNK